MGVLEIIAGVLEPVFNLLLHKIVMKNNRFIVRLKIYLWELRKGENSYAEAVAKFLIVI